MFGLLSVLLHVILFVEGLLLIVYGIIVSAKASAVFILSYICWGVGVADVISGVLGVLSRWLPVYFLLQLAALAASIAGAVVFLATDKVQDLINDIDPSGKDSALDDFLQNNIKIVGYIFAGVAGFRALAMLLATCRVCSQTEPPVDDLFDEESAARGYLLSSRQPKRGWFGRNKAEGDRFAAMADEGLNIERDAAKLRFQQRNRGIYEKYQITRD